MILHAASIAAFFVDQMAFEPVQIQCVSNAGQDTILVRLLFDAVPSIFALGIAALVFYWNGGREHKRWVLDQKKVEWRELLSGMNSVYFPMALAKQLKKPLQLDGSQRLHELSQCFQDRVFIDASILTKFQDQLESYASEYIGKSEDKPPSDELKSKVLDKLKVLTKEVRDAAKKDLKAI